MSPFSHSLILSALQNYSIFSLPIKKTDMYLPLFPTFNIFECIEIRLVYHGSMHSEWQVE